MLVPAVLEYERASLDAGFEYIGLVAGKRRAEAIVADIKPMPVADPVCGMTVTVVPDTPHAVVDGVDVWFCADACRGQYLAEPTVTPCS